MIPTEQQNRAMGAFVACVVAKLNPSLVAHTHPARARPRSSSSSSTAAANPATV